MARPVVATSSRSYAGASTSVTIVLPSHSEGDLIVLNVFVSRSTAAMGVPTGYTSLLTQISQNGIGRPGSYRAFAKIAGASESNPVVSNGSASSYWWGEATIITGATATIGNITNGTSTKSGTPNNDDMDLPSATVDTADSIALRFSAQTDDNITGEGSASPPTSHTKIINNEDPGGRIGVGYCWANADPSSISGATWLVAMPATLATNEVEISCTLVIPPGGPTIIEADGSASGVASSSTLGAAIWNTLIAAAGVAATAIVGAALVLSAWSSVGLATVDAPSASVLPAVVASVGTGVASADTLVIATGDGSVAGVASLDGIGGAIAGSDGAVVGLAVLDGDGGSIASTLATSPGVATSTGIGVGTAQTDASAVGVATVLADGKDAGAAEEADASSEGVAVVSGIGVAMSTTVASAEGVGVASGFGEVEEDDYGGWWSYSDWSA